jgi:hypothetical protein
MHPLVRGAAAAAVLTALGSFDRGAPAPAASEVPPGESRGVDGLPAPCGAGTLPEGPVCIRIPREEEAASLRLAVLPDLPADRPGAVRDAPSRGGAVADRIPRRPERPADPAKYVYPVGAPDKAPRVIGGLDEPGIRLAVRPGDKVTVLALEHQVGPAEVVFAGDLFGRTIVTAHVIEEGSRKRTLLLFHGGLDHTAPGAVQGARLEPGAELGAARTELGAGLIDVYLEAREVREGAKIDGADGKRLVDPATSVPTDVRNVLPMAP